tara:strand:+ start:12 stop:503 length:492 start_codon:yes stop_codon:yes gene_type:complete
MINISYYENKMYDSDVVNEITNSFNATKQELNLVHGKTIMVKINIRNKNVASICLIPNSDLSQYLLTKGMDYETMNTNYLFRANEGVYIYNMSVNKNYRGKGLGHKLLDITLHICNLLKYDYCYAHCENEISYHIFNKKGFNKENVFRNKDNEIVALMSYWLN